MSPTNFACKVFWFVLCILHLVNITGTFFEYRTVTNVVYTDFDHTNGTNLELCFEYSQIIDLNKINSKYGTRIKFSQSDEFVDTLQGTVTVNDILNFTLDDSDLVVGCLIRTNLKSVTRMNKTECYKHFSIEKNVVGPYVCYDMSESITKRIDYKSVALSLQSAQVIFEVELNPTICHVERFRPTIHSHGAYAEHSRKASPIIERNPKDFNAVYKMTFARRVHKELSYPYGRNLCVSNQSYSINVCKAECTNNKTVEAFGKVDYATMYTIRRNYDPLFMNASMISSIDLKNDTLVEELHRIEEGCKHTCKAHVCTYDVTLTTVIVGYRKRNNNPGSLVIGSLISNHPELLIEALVKVSLIDLIVYITSVLGTWFGLVIIKITPGAAHQLWKQSKQKWQPRTSPEPSETSEGF